MGLEEIYRLVLLFGSSIIFVLSFILWFHPKGLFTNKLLGVLIFSWGYTVFIFSVQSKAFFIKYPHTFGIGTNLIFLFFPLMYLYIKTYIYVNARKVRNIWVHFVPFVLFTIFLSKFLFQSSETKSKIIEQGLPLWVKDVFFYGDIAIICLGIFYTVLAFRIIHKFEYPNIGILNKNQLKTIQFLKQFLVINAILWAVGTSGVIIETLEVNIPFDLFKIYYIGLTLLTIWISIFTIYQPDMLAAKERESELNLNAMIGIQKMSWVGKRNSSQEENESDAEKIINFIEREKPFLNPEMTLDDLSNGCSLTRHRVSDLLNSELALSFNDAINDFRIKEFITLLNDGKHKQHTLIYLAELSGFNSKATFNRCFKKKTGKTPSEYIKENI